MYRKRKATSTPQIDVEELKRFEKGGTQKIAEKGDFRRPEAYTGGSGNTIPWH
jgi:hypothetical protein